MNREQEITNIVSEARNRLMDDKGDYSVLAIMNDLAGQIVDLRLHIPQTDDAKGSYGSSVPGQGED